MAYLRTPTLWTNKELVLPHPMYFGPKFQFKKINKHIQSESYIFSWFQIFRGIRTKTRGRPQTFIKSWLSLEHLPCELLPHSDVHMFLCLNLVSSKANKLNWTTQIFQGTKTKKSRKASNTAKSWLSLEHLPCELLLPHPDVHTYLCSIPLTSWHIFHSFSVNIRRNRAILCKSELVFFWMRQLYAMMSWSFSSSLNKKE
jgi:hypothetical protein